MSTLPQGWAEAQIGEVCEVVGGSTPKTSNSSYWGGDIAWITPDDLSKHREKFIAHGARSITAAGYGACSTKMLPSGAVLYTTRAPIGYVAVASSPVCTNQGFKSFIPPTWLSSDYLYWYLKFATPEIRSMGSGTTFTEVSAKVAKTIPLLIPPSNEQLRIVAAIEEQFSRLDAGVASLQRAQRNLARMRASILSAAVEGRLLPQIARSANKPWKRYQVSDIASVGSGATPKRGEARYWSGGRIPWVTSGQVNELLIEHPAAFITDAALKETSVKLWPKHTLLVAMYGEGQTRGRCAELLIEATTNQACAAIVMKSDFEYARGFLKLFFDASYDKNRRLASGGVQPNLNLGLIKELTLCLPPPEVAAAVTGEVERQFSILDAMEASVAEGLQRANRLRQAILREAFSGRLVPQDPEDEPASVLLERIKTERVKA